MSVNYLKRDGKPSLAYIHSKGMRDDLPLVMFCGGYRSDMAGSKAAYLEAQCSARGQAYLRFDYRGHGESEGDFDAAVMSDWMGDAIAVMELHADRPVLLVGSSMGGWIALLVALEKAAHIHGVIGLAAAPDFTEDMFHERLNAEQQAELLEAGIVYIPNDYSDVPYSYTRALYEDGKTRLLLDKTHDVAFPIMLMQGKADADVPWQTALRIQKAFGLSDDALVFIEDGDHRLSRPQDLVQLDALVQKMSGL